MLSRWEPMCGLESQHQNNARSIQACLLHQAVLWYKSENLGKQGHTGHLPRDPKVRNLDCPSHRQQHVGCLDIAVHALLRMHVGQCSQDLLQDVGYLRLLQVPLIQLHGILACDQTLLSSMERSRCMPPNRRSASSHTLLSSIKGLASERWGMGMPYMPHM